MSMRIPISVTAHETHMPRVSAQTRDIWTGQKFLRIITDRNLGQGLWQSCTYEDECYYFFSFMSLSPLLPGGSDSVGGKSSTTGSQ